MRRVFVDDILTSAESTSIAVASTATVYTKAIRLAFADYFALAYKAVSALGTPDVKIEIQQSYEEPDTEGATDTDWVEPEGVSDVESSLTDENVHIKAIAPAVAPWFRLKITGNAANPADTIMRIRLMRQEEL